MAPSRRDNPRSIAKDVIKTVAPVAKDGEKPRNRSTQTAIVSSENVARRAYEFFLDRGGEHGQDLNDWFRAERELRRARD